jgi:hypothetical protein
MIKDSAPKTLDVISPETAPSSTVIVGRQQWKTITKAWNKEECWMKSTKALYFEDLGCVVQVTTESAGKGASEALVFIPGAALASTADEGIYMIVALPFLKAVEHCDV